MELKKLLEYLRLKLEKRLNNSLLNNYEVIDFISNVTNLTFYFAINQTERIGENVKRTINYSYSKLYEIVSENLPKDINLIGTEIKDTINNLFEKSNCWNNRKKSKFNLINVKSY